MDCEDTMRSRGLIIHVGSSSGSIAKSDFHIFLHNLSVINFDMG